MQFKYYYFDENKKIQEVPSELSLNQIYKRYGKKDLYREFIGKKINYDQTYSEELIDDGCGNIGHWGEREY